MPVNSDQARHLLGGVKPWSRSYMSAIKSSMGIRSRYFMVSDVKAFLASHPDFKCKRGTPPDTLQQLLSEALPLLMASKAPMAFIKRVERKLQLQPGPA
jgi:hypothetical protein